MMIPPPGFVIDVIEVKQLLTRLESETKELQRTITEIREAWREDRAQVNRFLGQLKALCQMSLATQNKEIHAETLGDVIAAADGIIAGNREAIR